MSARNFKQESVALSAPASKSFSVTPSDTTDFTYVARALYIGAGGDVVVVDEADTTTTFVAVPSGTILPVICKRVNSTNTTATSIVGMY